MKVYDPDIRKVLYRKFLMTKEFLLDSSTLVINEFDVCRGISRVDIAVINGKMHGYEIKSEQDTLERLPMQMDSYNKVFDKMTIVTGEKHLDKVTDIIPEWWGIYYITENKNKLVLKKKRSAKINRNIDILEVAQLLWRDELIKLLNSYDITKGLKSKTRLALSKLVSEKIPQKDVKDFVKNQLKLRTDWRAVQLQQLYDD
ncbi:hypothetical protein HMPREF1084_01976 [Clostridium butyricum 60E.3]|uniref:sce7726 family protein n=1 Tax=Clostridium butyricum TaxID=1492 RepID=UPI0002D16BDA|nr:sce7726 family protein [Clostridium butyricum]ALP91215.1 hypothetical protein ATN24_14055 [Clostridium butyricum]ANF14838.1 hypothetical protein AZ909_12510 [Clostridium butyricum]ENZ33507.1 hypothetical protein HMPREF1084_01976 [Clostridium butyricum 60E.3]MCI3009069.1 sce7726 family protein [Clostridium butyricum]MDP0841133.1 sce7726 family protein [Clostridium butyricum]